MKILLVFLFISSCALSQNDLHQVKLGLRYNRLDFFIEPSVVFQQVKVKHELGLGLGINRSFFQKRLFPEFSYSLSTNFAAFKLLDYQAVSSYRLSFYNPYKLNPEFHVFNEILLGFQLGLGKRFRTYFQPEIGLQSESFHSDFFDKNITHFTFTYSAKFGFSYVL